MMDVKLYRYALRPIDGRDFEWAEIVLGSNGFFAAVSDYGNYSFRWTHFGDRDFREFVIGLYPDYVHSTLTYGREGEVYDGDGTIRKVRARICEMRRENKIDREQARACWNEIDEEYGHLYRLDDFNEWYRHADHSGLIFDAWEIAHYKQEPQCWAFCTRILPRLKDLLRTELAQERASVVSVLP